MRQSLIWALGGAMCKEKDLGHGQYEEPEPEVCWRSSSISVATGGTAAKTKIKFGPHYLDKDPDGWGS